MMIKVRAKIKLYKSTTGRKTYFSSGYRPLFDFVPNIKTSGQINLMDKINFYPGEEGIVEINFINKNYLGQNFGKGTKFTFGEGKNPLGEGEIKEILS